jgi:hypothetical protein
MNFFLFFFALFSFSNKGINMEDSYNYTDKRKTCRNATQSTTSHSNSFGINSGLCSEKPITNSQNRGTARVF